MQTQFEWHEHKAALNSKKHGISFEEASTVFFDEFALLINDPEHSLDEERFILLGISQQQQILVVVHCLRGSNIRIISARRATKNEQRQYWKQRL